jgi:hypothetical protein
VWTKDNPPDGPANEVGGEPCECAGCWWCRQDGAEDIGRPEVGWCGKRLELVIAKGEDWTCGSYRPNPW